MKNNDWIPLPVFLDGFYSKDILDKAKMVKSHDEKLMDVARTIADTEGKEPGKFIIRWFPRDKMDILEWIQEDPDNPEYSDLFFADEDFWMVDMRHDLLMKKIHRFLGKEPTYRKLPDPKEIHVVHQPMPYPPNPDDYEDDDE